MFKKIIISLLSVCVIAGTLLLGFLTIYFSVPSKKAQAEIELASQVADLASVASDTSENDTTDNDEEDNIYVADVHQSLSFRSQPSSDSETLIEGGLEPLTKLELQESIDSANDFVYVQVLDGPNKDLFGYVNKEFITKLGEPTVRATTQEN